MLPDVSAFSTIAVLPSPCWCTTPASPADSAVRLIISPRMYDSVKRFDPTLSVAPDEAVAHITASVKARDHCNRRFMDIVRRSAGAAASANRRITDRRTRAATTSHDAGRAGPAGYAVDRGTNS